jgi:class 3 adenylate cyclase/RNA polymerase subunit RPABC4/transcription elongation factor Spt4
MECLRCQAIVPDGAKFCMECGTPLPRACPTCTHLVPAGAKFCPECGAPLAAPASPLRADEPVLAKQTTCSPSAERRHLTVMFCDLVGSTALSAELDPEDLRDVIATYHGCVSDVVRRFDGYVAKYMGDGVLVYFGYPQAHEDDVERAVRSGLDLVAAVERLEPRNNLELRVRIGIATGLVVVGDLIGEGAAREPAVVGETPNLAARLQALAEPGQVIISRSTRRLLGDTFELADLGERLLKGIAEPVRSWRVLRPSEVESRFDAFHGSSLGPLVGREQELALLLERLERANDGEGQ